MSMQSTLVTSESELNETDREVLDELQHGARTKGFLVDETGRHRNTIGMRLEVLEAKDFIRCIHEPTALYELADDPQGE